MQYDQRDDTKDHSCPKLARNYQVRRRNSLASKFESNRSDIGNRTFSTLRRSLREVYVEQSWSAMVSCRGVHFDNITMEDDTHCNEMND
jgi:hypothetical protein